jgi:hypothetical protein
MKLISIVGRRTAAPFVQLEPHRDFVGHSFVDASCVAQTQGFFLHLSWIEDAHIRRSPTDKVGKKKHALALCCRVSRRFWEESPSESGKS